MKINNPEYISSYYKGGSCEKDSSENHSRAKNRWTFV